MRRINSCLVSALLSLFLLNIIAHASDRSIDKELQSYLGQSKLVIEQLGRNLQSGRSINNEIESLRSLVENIKASHVLNIEQFKLREENITAHGGKALQRHRAISEAYRKAVEEYLSLLEDLVNQKTISLTNIDRTKITLDKILHVKKRPILGNLPYRNLSYPSREPSSDPPIKPAYKGGNKTVTPEDIKSTAESPISEEIANLAQSLNWNPVSIYEWVKNNIETEWYRGSMKGAEETLSQKSGNDCDQASLLIALLRASGFPARYVRGVIEFFPDIEKTKNLIGINDPTKLAEFFQRAGIPFKPVIAGGRISNFQVEHIWVEAEIPYANYRGAPLDQHGKTWLGLDTSIKAAGYTYNTPIDLPQDISLLTVRDAYLNAAQTLTPIEYLKAYIESQLATRNPPLVNPDSQPATYNDLLRIRNIIPEVMNILPASMQFEQKKITHEYVEVPDDLKHKVRFIATRNSQPATENPDNEIFSFELGTFLLSNQKVALSYEPENIEDQEIIDSYGGLDNTPAYLVRLRPVLAINGERMVVGRDGMPMGSDYTVTIELVYPNGTEKITSVHIIGNVSVIGIVAQKTIPGYASQVPSDEKDAEQILYEEAMNYIDRWNKAEDELASLLRFSVARPLPSVVTLGGVIDVSYLLDTPHEFDWKGVFIDSNLRTIETVQNSESGVQNEKQKTFMQLAALQGSILENRIFEDDFQVEGISTAKLFSVVRGTQPATEILTIDKTNLDVILPMLSFDDSIKEDIKNSVNQNFTIRIPQSEISYQDWSGIGYIKENPVTGESGYMLSGMIAGGMTAWGIDKWPAYYADILSNTSSEPANEDPASATSIQKITKTDLQKGRVGQPLEQPLQVIVKDKKGRPVPKVEITFTIKKGGGKFSDGSTTAKAKTLGDGIASVRLVLGQKTSDNPTFLREEDPNKPYAQQVGENIVEASLPSGTKITRPFTAYGLPGDAVQIKQTAGDGWQGTILSFAGFVSVIIADQYENPISNVPITFSVLAAIDRSGCENPNQDVRQAVLVERDDPCLKNSPTLNQCTSAASSLVEKTDSKGALVQVILGSIPKAEYQITAVSGSLNTMFRLYTNAFGNCSGADSPSIEFSIDYVYLSDSYGNNITAGKTGSAIPVQAKIYFLKEGEAEKEITMNCIEGLLTCTKIVGNRQYSRVTEFLSSSVTFDGQGGVAKTNGIYTSTYTLKPGYNQINVLGKATTEYRWTDVSCPATCRPRNEELERNAFTMIGVYGVDIQINPIPMIVGNEQGYSSKDYEISYTISPSDYKALTAFLFIYKDGEPIATIPTEAGGTGKATIARGFQFDLNSKYEIEVVLNPGTGVEIRSDKQEIKFAEIYIEKEDPEYPDVKLRWDDYYPALGGKVITIRTTKESLNDSVVKFRYAGNTASELEAIDHKLTGSDPTGALIVPIDEKITDKRMRFRIAGSMLAPKVESDPPINAIDEINLKFYIEGNEDAGVEATYHVKNNFNTTFGEVLSGEAVFVYDDNGDDNHTGKTEGNVIIDDDKKFDFVQELLNQVVPRKRSVGQNYQLVESNGFYDEPVMNAVNIFRINFGFTSTSSTFAKLKKDYSNPIMNEAVWLNKVIEKNVLVGKDFSPQDKLINGETGLYELYKNVVKPFINNMINEANRYANATGFSNPQGHWKPRTYPNDPAQTIGMSYCFGCKNSINTFNDRVAHCQVEETDNIKNHETDGTDNGTEYRGNVRGNDCGIGGGDKRWPGLYSSILGNSEYNLFRRCILDNQPCTNSERLQARAFDPRNWAGIDCSGLVTSAGEQARNSLGAAVNLLDLGRNSCTFFFTKTVCDAHVSAGGPPLYITDQPSGFNYNFGVNDQRNTSPTSKIRRGDLVSYDGHISIVYSETPNCSGTSCSYQIIHASGYQTLCYRPSGSGQSQCQFNRKVLTNLINNQFQSTTLKNPVGFGRIKLWP